MVVCLLGTLVLPADGTTEGEEIIENLASSVVKVKVSQNGRTSIATGFIWGRPDTVITSLHVMHPGPTATINIEYNRSSQGIDINRTATLSRVLPQADLMLLTVNNPYGGWVPLTETDLADTAEFNEALFAYGHHMDAGLRSRSMRRGYLEVSILKALIPADELESIKQAGIPSTDLEIIYLDAGSLLPGCSGAPIINSAGKLVGIGDGGLEQGAMTISWGIPAINIFPLVQNGATDLPDNFSTAVEHFSADLYEDESQAQQTETLDFLPYRFTRIKTRSLAALMSGADSPVTLHEKILSAADKNRALRSKFDVYEDTTKEIALVVPEGSRLRSDATALKADIFGNTHLRYTRSRVDPKVFEDPYYLYSHEKEYLADLKRRYPDAGYDLENIESMDYGRGKRMIRARYKSKGSRPDRYVTFLFNQGEVFAAEAVYPKGSRDAEILQAAAHLTSFTNLYSEKGVIPAASILVAHYPFHMNGRDVGPRNQKSIEVRPAIFTQNALYIDPRRQGDHGIASPRIEGFDLDSYAVEAQFKVSAYKDNPVVLIGRAWRVLGVTLTKNGSMEVFSQQPISYTATDHAIHYQTNRWHTLKLVYKKPYFSLYLDNRKISRGKCLTDQRAKDRGENKILFYNSANARNYSGYIRDLKIFGPPKVLQMVPTLKYLRPYIHLQPKPLVRSNIPLQPETLRLRQQ